MQQVWPILLTIIPIFLIVGTGMVLRATKTLNPQADSCLTKLVVRLLIPCLILHKTIGSEALTHLETLASSFFLGFTIIILTTAIAYFGAGLFGFKKGTGRRTFGFSAGLQNYGFLAIPLVDSLFPHDGAIAILFVHNVGVEIAMWTVGVAMLSGNFKPNIKTFFNAPFIAALLGVTINLLNLTDLLPNFATQTIQMFSYCALPIALLLIGTTLFDLYGKEKTDLKVCFLGILFRMIIAPAIILACALCLPLPLPLKQVLAIQAAMPAAMFPIVLARHYNGQVGVAVQIVLSTTAISLISMPFVILLGIKLLNL